MASSRMQSNPSTAMPLPLTLLWFLYKPQCFFVNSVYSLPTNMTRKSVLLTSLALAFSGFSKATPRDEFSVDFERCHDDKFPTNLVVSSLITQTFIPNLTAMAYSSIDLLASSLAILSPMIRLAFWDLLRFKVISQLQTTLWMQTMVGLRDNEPAWTLE